MATTLRRDIVQESCFVAKVPYPREPHKNLRIDEALRLAKAWGCRIWSTKGSDVCVVHDLVKDTRGAMPVSTHRHDTPQSLVTYIRKVIAATHKYWKEHPAMKGGLEAVRTEPVVTARTNGTPALELTPKEYAGNERYQDAEVSFSDKEVQGVLPAKFDHLNRDYSLDGDGIVTMFSAAQYIHYREHAGNGTYMPIWNCPNLECKRVCDEVTNYKSLKKVEEEALRMIEERDQQIRALKEGMPKDLPKPEVAPTPGEDLTTIAGRRHAYLIGLEQLRRKCSPWPEHQSVGVKTRVFQALEILGEQQRWSPELLQSLNSRDFTAWKIHIRNMKKPGGKRNILGIHGWEGFEMALASVRNKEKQV